MFNWVAFVVTICIAFILALSPMPGVTIWLKPAWVLLTLIFWVLESPNKISIRTAFIVGLLYDLLSGTILGEHALAFTVVIFFVARMHIRLRMYPILQQTFSVLIFVLLYQIILFCVQGFIGDLPGSSSYWLSSLTSMLLWPWFNLLMRHFLRKLKIA